MLISELIEKLQTQLKEWGDVRAVKWDGRGDSFSEVFWDEDSEGNTVVVVD